MNIATPSEIPRLAGESARRRDDKVIRLTKKARVAGTSRAGQRTTPSAELTSASAIAQSFLSLNLGTTLYATRPSQLCGRIVYARSGHGLHCAIEEANISAIHAQSQIPPLRSSGHAARRACRLPARRSRGMEVHKQSCLELQRLLRSRAGFGAHRIA